MVKVRQLVDHSKLVQCFFAREKDLGVNNDNPAQASIFEKTETRDNSQFPCCIWNK